MKSVSKWFKKAITLLILPFIIIIAVLSVNIEQGASASVYDLSSNVDKLGFSTEAQDTKVKIYVSEELYQSYSLKISYQRVKLNYPLTDNVTQVEGKVVDKNLSGKAVFEVLDENVQAVTAKSDLKLNEESSIDSKAYYFEVATKANCAWIFTVEREPGQGDEIQKDYHIVYFRKIDFAVPTFNKSLTIWSSTGYNVSFSVYDNRFAKSAMSGIKSIMLYKKNGEDYDKIEEWQHNGISNCNKTFNAEKNGDYYLEVIDKAGNTTGKKILCAFVSEVYDEVAESTAENAIADFQSAIFAQNIVTSVVDAYAEYMAVTRDITSTEEEKQLSCLELKNALKFYIDAERDFANGKKVNVNVDITNAEITEGISISNAENALSFLAIGDKVNMSVSPAYFKYSDDLNREEELKKAGLSDADGLYAIQIKCVSENEFELRREFSNPLSIRFKPKEYKDIKAVQTVRTPTGGVEYYECNIVGHTDGTVHIDVMHTSGTVNIFIEDGKNDNLYWLFSLTAVPLIVGAVLLIYAFRKIKKIKINADMQNEGEKQPQNAQKKVLKKRKKK